MKRTQRHVLRTITFLLVALFLSTAVSAQSKVPQATVSASIVTPGDETKIPALEVVLEIPPGLHAQSRTPLDPNLIKLDVALDPAPPGVTFGDATYPPGEEKSYPSLGKLSVYEGRVVVRVPFFVNPQLVNGDFLIKGKIRYQLCDENFCFPPKSVPFSVPVALVPPQAGVTSPANSTVPPAGNSADPNSNAVVELVPSTAPLPASLPVVALPVAKNPVSLKGSTISGPQWSVVTAFGAALVAGLLFNIMPCVLPVLPLKAMGFYEVAQHRRLQSIFYGLAFSVGVVAVFGVLSVLVLVLHRVSWGGLFSYGWFVWSIVVLLVGMALSLFGVFTFLLPNATYNFTPRHDTYTGNFLWGGLTAVLATPCTAPLLPLLLLWALAQPTFLGVAAMLMVGVGMSIPYLLLSAFPELARRFPRSGPWPELFKQMMGFMILGTAVYFGAGRLIHGPAFFWPVCAVAAVASMYLMARTVQLTKNAGPVVVSSVLAIAALGATFWWSAQVNGWLVAPSAFNETVASATRPSSAAGAGWVPYSTERFNTARAGGSPVLVKFTANWCATCQFIEGTVFRDPGVLKALSDAHVTLIKVDLSDTGAPGSDLLLQLNPAGGIPLTAVFAPGVNTPALLSSVYTGQTLIDTLNASNVITPIRD